MSVEFEQCVTTHRNRWIRVAACQMPYHEAEDLVQDAIFRGWRGLGEFKGKPKVSFLTKFSPMLPDKGPPLPSGLNIKWPFVK